jgi:hypothetical protein
METEQQAAATPSMGMRIANVFMAPSEAFDGLTTQPSKTAIWVLPFILSLLLGIGITMLIFSDDILRGQVMDAQVKVLEKRVAEGKMTQEQFEQTQQGMERMGSMFMVIGAIGAVVVLAAYFFGAALILWLLGKFGLKSPEGFSTYLSVYGLASWIGIVGGIITVLMMYGMGSLYATPSLGLLASPFDPLSLTDLVLAKVDIFALWQAAIVGIGLGKITNKSLGTGIGIGLGLWVLWFLVSIGWTVLMR